MNRIRWLTVAVGALAVVVWRLVLSGPPLPSHPTVVVVAGSESDPRLPLVREAVGHWNEILSEAGASIRLGEPALTLGAVADEELIAASETVRSWWPHRPEVPFDGDLVVVLSDAEFISFASRGRGRAVVAIKSGTAWPLTLPNVARNVIAHEIGHALGLGHNRDPSALMCGRPAPCRPDVYESADTRWFPLTDDERAQLRRLYQR